MAVKLLCLCLLLGLTLICPSQAKKQRCLTSASTCEKCIKSGPACAWCTSPYSSSRCHTLKGLRRTGCPEQYVYNPQGGVQVVKNDSRTEPVNSNAPFLQPQEFSLHLRPGVSQSFPLTITVPTDRPITEMNMDISGVPAGVNITFMDIVKGNPMVVQVNVEAGRCPGGSAKEMQNGTGPWSVDITPRGFSLSVKLDITLECQCACTSNREENSVGCRGHGARVCGRCECYEPYVGPQCETYAGSFFSPGENACRSGPDVPVCSGRGKCVDGICECENRANPEEKLGGKFCECSNFDCPRYNNRMCGGHGECACGQCVCDDNWTNEDCSCTMETASCMTHSQVLCNGRGACQCGQCACDSEYYAGPTCEDCPTCPGICQRHVECVECLAFGTGAKQDRCEQECGYLTVTMVENRRDITEPFCMMRSSDFCVFYYTFSGIIPGGQTTVLRAKEC